MASSHVGDRVRDAWRREVGRRAGAGLQLIDSKAAVVAIRVARLYQKHLQPASGCLYAPVCSDYAIAAFKEYGFHDGVIMAAQRLQRCNPEGREAYYAIHQELGDPAAGYDPCPGRGRMQLESSDLIVK